MFLKANSARTKSDWKRIGFGSESVSFGALISTGLRLVSWAGEHPGLEEETLVSSSALLTGDRGTWTQLYWCSWGCLDSVRFAAQGFGMWHLLFSQALSQLAGELLSCVAWDSSVHGTICEHQAWERAPGHAEREKECKSGKEKRKMQ